MRLLTTIDYIWIYDVLRVSSEWTSQISYESVASLQHTQAICAVPIIFYSIAAKYNGQLIAAQAHINIDTIWIHDVLRVTSEWTSQISYESVASLQHTQAVCALPIIFYSIAAKYNRPLIATHAFIDDDRLYMDSWCAAGALKMDLSDQLRVCSIASTCFNIHKPSAHCKWASLVSPPSIMGH